MSTVPDCMRLLPVYNYYNITHWVLTISSFKISLIDFNTLVHHQWNSWWIKQNRMWQSSRMKWKLVTTCYWFQNFKLFLCCEHKSIEFENQTLVVTILGFTILIDLCNMNHVLATGTWFTFDIYHTYLNEIQLLKLVICCYQLPTLL